MTIDVTIPVSIAVFFVGLILMFRVALPKFHDRTRISDLEAWADKQSRLIATLEASVSNNSKSLDVAEANIKTLNGNLVTLRDQGQFKALAGAMRGGSPK